MNTPSTPSTSTPSAEPPDILEQFLKSPAGETVVIPKALSEAMKNRAEIAEMDAAQWEEEAKENEVYATNYHISYLWERRERHLLMLMFAAAAAFVFLAVIVQCSKKMKALAVGGDHE